MGIVHNADFVCVDVNDELFPQMQRHNEAKKPHEPIKNFKNLNYC
jgi:hypothetical protein